MTLPIRELPLLDKIEIIAFDLDDTLWPCMPTIKLAEETLYQWLSQNFPRITDGHSPEDMVSTRKQFMLRDEQFAIDMTLMRYEFLKQLAREADYDPTQVSEEGFEVFYEARQRVSFYDDVLPCLHRLQSKYRLGAISNGNANVEKVGLGHLIEHSVSASELKVAKPSRLIFEDLVERFGVSADRVLYVGDHPEFDVVGPEDAGLQAIWINRENNDWPEHLRQPKYQISNLHELELLL
jgi:HAD superfamily hydrolase (TIGR01549 family)